MHEYYFKIKKCDIEFECSTTDKFLFEEKLSDWINRINNIETIQNFEQETKSNEIIINTEIEEMPQRSGFIDVKSQVSINEISNPTFGMTTFNENKQKNEYTDFEQVLEESIQNPKTKVVEKIESLDDFENYLKSYNPENDTDKLMITAKYILNVENQNCFSIKQLNSKLVPLTGSPIDHSMIEEAINQNLVRIYPDLTGTAEYTEYTLTEEGEGYFID